MYVSHTSVMGGHPSDPSKLKDVFTGSYQETHTSQRLLLFMLVGGGHLRAKDTDLYSWKVVSFFPQSSYSFPGCKLSFKSRLHQAPLGDNPWKAGVIRTFTRGELAASRSLSFLSFFLFFFFFCLFRATLQHMEVPRLGAVAAGLHHSHRKMGSELRLWPTPQLMAAQDP